MILEAIRSARDLGFEILTIGKRTVTVRNIILSLNGVSRRMRYVMAGATSPAMTRRPSCSMILNRSEKEWKMPPREWSMAKAQFAVIFGERFIKAMAT